MKELREIAWLVVLGFNTTFTGKGHIIAVSDAHMFPDFLTPVLTSVNFLSKATDYFSHMLLQR